ncbi:MAG: tRNA (adenosine(37)-N6)-dimethylallyltransferase MiaA [Candidatus Colwellbacteria bacterium]|nr:tRNA (adenosine(37)-N6)-dimethylallyltransferase MiaA [Candidatus Colwellbacteria bacterium]
MDLPKVLVILGPTTSGKSALAVKLALRLPRFHSGQVGSGQAKKKYKINGAEIISADSRQVYKGLDIGTGKITKKEMRGVSHHMLDVASPKKTFTVVQYQKLAKQAMDKILKKKKLPIIVGGTGLYIDALIYDTKFPRVKPQKGLRKKLEKLTTDELVKKLKKLDPKRAKNIDKYNRRRLIRALEIVLATGKPIPSLISAGGGQARLPAYGGNRRITKFDILKIGLNLPKEELQKKIKKRLEDRLKKGLVAEVRKLKKQLGGEKLDNFGLEYRYVNKYLDRQLTYDQMTEKLLTEIWRYAKRQMTWFSAKGGSASGGKRDKEINWIKNRKEAEKLVKGFLLK